MKLTKKFTLLSSLLTMASLNLSAQLYNWTNGGGDASFHNPLNWEVGGVAAIDVPSDNNEAIFDNTTYTVPSAVTLSADVEIDRLLFKNTVSTTIGDSSKTITISRTSNAAALRNNGSGSVIIASNVAFTPDGATNQFIVNDAGGTLTVNGLVTISAGNNVQTGGGGTTFNGGITGAGNGQGLRLNSTGNSITGGTVDSGLFFLNTSSMSITGGTFNGKVGSDASGSGTLNLNGGVINGDAVSLNAGRKLTLNVNVDSTFGTLSPLGTLTIDVTAGNSIAFADSSALDWTGGSITIAGFAEGLVTFGTDAFGLTVDQLALINGGAYSLDSSGSLTAVPEPATFALISGVLALGLMFRRRRNG